MRPIGGAALVVALVVAGLLLGAGGAAAGGSKSADLARAHYLEGQKLFGLAQYDDAGIEFEIAYKLKSDAAFLYNIAQCHRLARHHEKAIRYYRNFLGLLPDAPNRAKVEAYIVELEAALKQESAPPALKPAPAPTPAPAPAPAPTTKKNR